jgi:FG-GAP repeat
VLAAAFAAGCGGQASPPHPKHPLAAGAGADLRRVAGLRIAGAHAGDAIGGRIAAAGDVNGDGLADLVIGSPTSSRSTTFAGTAYVVYGRRRTANIDLADLGGGGFRIDGAQAGDRIGEAVDGAGDVNGDGLDDVVVGPARSMLAGRTRTRARPSSSSGRAPRLTSGSIVSARAASRSSAHALTT